MATPNVLVRLHYYEPNSEGRELYSSAKKDDYVNYVDKGIRQTDGKPSDYLAYSDDREKSSGVFNANGPIPVKEKKKLREKLRSTGSCIWDCVISFEEKYGVENCDSPEEARKLLCKVLPPFFKSIGLNPEKTTWYAGLHRNTDNRHIHLSFFQEEPKLLRPQDEGDEIPRKGMMPTKSFPNSISFTSTVSLKRQGDTAGRRSWRITLG